MIFLGPKPRILVTCFFNERLLEIGRSCRYSRSFSAVSGADIFSDISLRIFRLRRRRDSYYSLRNAASLSFNYSSISSIDASVWFFCYRT